MVRYNIGYINKPYADNDFVIMATTTSKYVAWHIAKSYNKDYGENGLSIRVHIRTDVELPSEFRYI